MLSPNDVVPKSKAASIWSFDSGYGSNTLEDDELHPQSDLWHEQAYAQPTSQPIGLGIDGLWNVHVKDQLRLRRSESPVEPVTTKLNVFTTQTALPESIRPLPSDATTCITCQLWDLTNPGQGLLCDGCKSKDYVRPEVLHLFDSRPKAKLTVPRLDIPHETGPKHSSKRQRQNKTRCSACDLARATDANTPTCASCSPDPNLLSPISSTTPSTVRRSCAKRPAKLPQSALQRLRAWLKDNRDDPYPSAETKRALAQECKITEKQVTTWFTNTRARKLGPPNDRSHSSEDEGAYESDFSSFTNTPVCTTSPTFRYDTPSDIQGIPPFSGPSTYDTSQLSLQTSRRGKKKDYRRLNTVSPIDDSPLPRTPATPSPNRDGTDQETWHCTFCYTPLVQKSWRRHEETQHRPKYQWTCLATGPMLRFPSRTGMSSLCTFCQLKNPSNDHFLHSHRIVDCLKKNEADRTFGRPDHLRQHVKNFHRASLLDIVRDKWRKDGPGKNVNEGWTCGFCQAELKTWDIRETHIANHFKDGMHISAWRDYPQPAAPMAVAGNSRRPSHEAQTNVLHNLTRRLTRKFPHRANHTPAQLHQQPSTFSNAFAPLPISNGCSNINTTLASAQPISNFEDMGMGNYMTEPTFMPNEFPFATTTPMANHYGPTYVAPPNPYDMCVGNDNMDMDFSLMAANPELMGNIMDLQEWDQEAQ